MKVSRFKLAFAVLLIVTILRRVWASAAFKHGIDLNAIVKAFPHVKYQLKVFPGARL